jgi:peptide/nickel transport system permease protein
VNRLTILTDVLRANSSLRLSLVLLVGLGLLCTAGSSILGDPLHQDLKSAFVAPGVRGHILGTDALGRDVLAWIALGIRTGLVVSMSVVLVSALLGVFIGLLSGYAGGALDSALMRVVDLQLAIPPLLLFIAASVLVGSNMISLIVLLSIIGWVPYARVVRSKVLSERQRAYVEAARLAGTTKLEILVNHLLPTTMSLIVVLATLQAGLVLLWESGLSFLGLGLQPPVVSLGFIIALGRSYLVQAWWVVTIPGMVIVLMVLAFNLLGDGLRDWFNLDLQVLDR